MAYDAIMRWENEGGALLPARPPAGEHGRPIAVHAKAEGAKPRGSGFRAEEVSELKRDVRTPPGAPAA